MKYFEKAYKFLWKNYLIAVPLFIALALPALIATTASGGLTGTITRLFKDLQSTNSIIDDPMLLFSELGKFFAVATGAAILGFILNFIAQPATAGMVNKGIKTGNVDLNDFSPALCQNIVKYIFYWLGTIVFGIVIGIIAIILLLILILLVRLLGGFGIFLMVLGVIAMILAGICINVLLTLWFPAMVIDDLGVVDAFKKSIEIAKTSFWTILGVTVLVYIIGVIAGFIFGLFAVIPVIGGIFTSIVPTITGVGLMIFYFMVYRDKTGRHIE